MSLCRRLLDQIARHKAAKTSQALKTKRITQTGNSHVDQITGKSSNLLKNMVGVGGFELPTSCSQSRRATRLRYTPRARHYTE